MEIFILVCVIVFLLLMLAIVILLCSIIRYFSFISEYLENCKNGLFDIAEELSQLKDLKEIELLDNENSK